MCFTWLDASGLEEILQCPCIIVLILEGMANIIPQLGVVLVDLKWTEISKTWQ